MTHKISIFWRIASMVVILCAAQSTFSQEVTPDSITLEHLKQAIEKARKALNEQASLQPDYRPESDYIFWRTARYNIPQELRNPMGNQALVCWALLATGESYQNPAFSRRLNWVMSGDRSLTYDRGMRLAMLSQLPRKRWGRWVRRDVMWLTNALTDKGNFTESWFGKPNTGYGDNANGQYGGLGLWVYQRAGYSLKSKVWKAVDRYWRDAMIKTDGGKSGAWAVFSPKAAAHTQGVGGGAFTPSAPMTAGAVATLCVTERALHAQSLTNTDKQNVSVHLRKGLHWLDKHFSLDDSAQATDKYYYYWTIQRLGGFIGYRSFNGIDWYRNITAKILNEQLPDGTWQGPKGRLISTGFALLYLAEAYDPVAFGKLRFNSTGKGGKKKPFAWNNHPHDLWNLTEYISDQYEYGTTWHIVTADIPIYSLMESPVLFLSTDAAFEFGETELKNLRDYIQAGGLLVTNPDMNNADVARSINKLAEGLFPGKKLEKIDTSHDLYHIHQDVPPKVGMQMISNGIRPQWIHFFRDIGKQLQTNDVARGDGFRAMSNIYLYVTGKNVRRQRLASHYISKKNDSPAHSLEVVRIKHQGNFDPEPGALQQLNAIAANDHDIDLKTQSIDAAQLSPDHKIAFLTTTGDGKLSDENAKALRQWLSSGGLLWLDAAGGSKAASDAMNVIAAQLAGEAPSLPIAPLALNHPIISGEGLGKTAHYNRWLRYRNYALKSMGPVNVSRLQCITIDGRVAAIISSHDITCGLAGLDHWGIYGYNVDAARHLVANSLLWTVQKAK